MTLSSGTRLGPYEVIAAIGAGGMGEVYRGRDATLNRDVAIKVLPAAMAEDTERLARFKREAQVLASLNHPNIAHVHGFDAATLPDGSTAHFLAMEMVEGEDLSERLKRGAITVDESIEIAKQIAEGLEEAHEHGIIHRDLKPANVKVTVVGKVKILDFGLAKAMEGDPSASAGNSQLSHSPTMSRHMTEAGMIMGTAAYMSPEQARGKSVDKRTDIWSFGVVLFEMLTGERLFAGETASDVLAAVLTRDLDFARLPGSTPRRIRQLLRRCLERDPRQRLRDIGDARFMLNRDEPLADLVPPPSPGPPGWRARAPWWAAAGALVAVAFLLGSQLMPRRGGEAGVLHLSWIASPGERLGLADQAPRPFAISPDGSKMVYAVEKGSTSELRLRALDSGETTEIPGTEGGTAPFFSPDGKWIAFVGGSHLKKVALAGGAPLNLADLQFFRGGAWGDDGSIYFVPSTYTPVSRVPAAGGTVQPVTTIRTAEGEVQHRWPEVLPGGKWLIYVVGPWRRLGRGDHRRPEAGFR